MRYLALCCDYDGTLATHGVVTPATFRALERLIASGRRALLVTGRELAELATVCPRLDLFAYVVAENGALLYDPATRTQTPLAPGPPESFIATLRQRGVHPLSVGRVILATWEPHETTVIEVIRESGLELQVIFNKGAVMVLPAGVNKATGLVAALHRLGLSAHNTVAVGDAENDHALLAACECGAAVANALPALKERADLVTAGTHGAGVAELCEALLHDDLAAHDPLRHHISLAMDPAGREIRVSPYGERVLILSPSDRTRTLVPALLTQLTSRDYTFCAITSQARPAELPLSGELARTTASLGEPDRAPAMNEILDVLQASGGENVLVSLAALTPLERPVFVSRLSSSLAQLRAVSGRPHWIFIEAVDELQLAGEHAGALADVHTVVYTTHHPGALSRRLLDATTLLVASGPAPRVSIEAFCQAAALPIPAMDCVLPAGASALAWRPATSEPPVPL
jgi:hydroxymethylpyrimidine pyrophosphatase-like HAD family hydrolase